MNPYTFGISTTLINNLYSRLEMYKNPTAVIEVDKLLYLMLDISQFNPFLIDMRTRYLLLVIDNTSGVQFYTVNMAWSNTLTSLEPVTNLYSIPILPQRVNYTFSDKCTTHPIRFSVQMINKLQEQKIAVANFYNFFGDVFVLWNHFVMNFIFYKQGTPDDRGVFPMQASLTQTAYWNPKTQQWDTSLISYDICNGTIIGVLKERILFSMDDNQFLYYNNVFSIPNSDDMRVLIGGHGNFSYRKTSERIAQVCRSTQLHYQAPMNIDSLLIFNPLDQLYRFVCSFFNGDYYLYGFAGTNNPLNFFSVFQSNEYKNQQQVSFFISVASFYVDEPLPEEPFFEFDGLVLWINEEGNKIFIFRPTFPDFLILHSTLQQGNADLILHT